MTRCPGDLRLLVGTGGAALNTVVISEQRRGIDAAPERVWSLLSGSAEWSARPDRFAFDVAGAPAGEGRLLVLIGPAGAGCEVWQADGAESGQLICWQSRSTARGRRRRVKLSVLPSERGATALISAGELAPRWSAAAVRRQWQHELEVWLDGLQAAAEARIPWPGRGIPDDIARACTTFPAVTASVSASASVRISAPLAAVWQMVWSPDAAVATHWATLAAGHVPGSPYKQVGEMQYFVDRQPDGRLTAEVIVFQELDWQRRALIRGLSPPHSLMEHLVTAQANATRLELTWIVPTARQVSAGGRARLEITKYVQTSVTRYKQLIEKTSMA